MRIYERKGNFGIATNDAPRNVQKVDGEAKEIYFAWHNMLRRCYDPAHYLKYPTYIGCSVCDEWLVYSNFEKFYKKHHRDGYELDKDILVKGNKLYSPQTCCFVPKQINYLCLTSKSKRGMYPIGVTYKHDKRKFKAYMLVNHKQVHIGYFDNPDDAFYAYKERKEEHIRNMATEYYRRGEIERNVYDALMRYNVEITD